MPQDFSLAQAVQQDEERQRRRQQQTAGQNLFLARPVAPERAALAQQAAGVLGRAPIEVQNDPTLEAEAQAARQMRALSEHHRTIQWLENPENAAVGHDQVEPLTEIERTMRRRLPAFLPDPEYDLAVARRLPGGAIEGIGRAVEGLNIAGGRALDRMGLGESWLADYFRAEGRVGRRISLGGRNLGGTLTPEERRGAAGQRNLLPAPNVETGLVGDISGGVGQVASQVMIAVGTAGYGTLLSMFGQGVSSMDDRVQASQQREGRTEYSAADDAALFAGGAVTVVTEKLGLDAILGRLPKPIRDRLNSRLADIMVAGLTEGTTEVAEGIGQNLLASSLLNEDVGALDGSIESGTVGAAVGSIARALLMTAIPGRQHINDQIRADVATSDAQRFDQVADMVAANPLLERAPERLREFLSGASDNQTVYVPAEAVATFFQSNPDLQEWIDEWDIRDQYEAALAGGSDIAFDVGTYLTKVAPTQAHQVWRQDLRHGLDAMSLKEAEAWSANAEQSLSDSFDSAFTEAEAMGREGEPTAAVYQDLFSQMRGAGYTVDVAQKQATLATTFFARRAERSGGRFADAMAAYRDAGLSIRQEFPQSLRERMDRTDVLIEGLRQARKAPSQRRMFGRSLNEFVSQEGGILDTGGDLAAIGADQWHRGQKFRRKLVRQRVDGDNSAYETDAVLTRAKEAGYLPEDATVNDLVEAIRSELSGKPVYSRDFETDPSMEENRQALDDLEGVLANLGMDPATSTNAEIKAALDRFANAPEASPAVAFEQGKAEARAVADSYRALAGIDKEPFVGPVQPNAEDMATIADAFEAAEHDPDDSQVRASYQALIDETVAQFQMMGDVKVEAWRGEGEPYANSKAMLADVRENGHLWFFLTDNGFGEGADTAGHPLLQKTGITLDDGTELLANDLFRIVHDYFGHAQQGFNFGPVGELNAYLEHETMYSDEATPALAAETLMQNAWVNFGPHLRGESGAVPARGEEGYVPIPERRFADQKAFLAPQEVLELAQKAKSQGPATKTLQQADGADMAPLIRPPVNEDGTITLTHWGFEPGLPELDPSKWGVNWKIMTRDERNRISSHLPRTFFGIGVGMPGGYRQERGLGEHRYEAQIDASRLYDAAADPDGFRAELDDVPGGVPAYDRINQIERRIAAKYDGYWLKNELGMTATVFKPIPVQQAVPEDRVLYQPAADTLARLGTNIPGLSGVLPYLSGEERSRLKTASAQKLVALVQSLPDAGEVASVAFSGRAKRGWYERSANALMEIFGAEDATRFAALLAAMSPQTSVESNAFNALATWVNWNKAGRPTDQQEIIEIMGRSVLGDRGVASVLSAWVNNSVRALTAESPADIELSGPKVNSFMANLVGVVDEVTNDAWMAAYAAIDPALVSGRKVSSDAQGVVKGKGPGYTAMNAVVRRAADILSQRTGEDWSPAEVQETVWSWSKTLYERRDSMDATTEEILAMGGLTHADIGDTPDFAILFTNGVYRNILEAGGYAQELGRIDAGDAGRGPAGAEGDVADAEGAGVAEDVFTGHLQSAARRLEGVRQARRGTPVDSGQLTLFQREPLTGARGQISLSNTGAVITLFKSRDLSTFFHEFGHLTLELMADDAAQPGASAAVVEDLNVALAHLGVASFDEVGVDHHELWARSLEAYLMEGRSPSLELRSVFKTVKGWMLSIYRTVLNLNAPLSDEVRSVFDRLLASDEEIEAASVQLGIEAGFADAEQAGMTAQQFADYTRQVQRARSASEDDLMQRMMRTIRRERTAEWNAEADAIRPDVTEEIDQQPDIRAMNWLRGSKVAMSREIVVRMLGDEAGLALLPKSVPPIVGKNGVHPDSVAEVAGYKSGSDLLNGLMELEAERQALLAANDKRSVRVVRIDREITARLREQFGDPLADGSIEAEAMAALHGDRQGEVLATELSVLARRVGQTPPPLAALRAWAAEQIGSRTVRDAKPGKYLRAERKAANAVQKALAAKDRGEAFRQKQAQTINHLLYSEARKAEEFADRAVRRLGKLDKSRSIRSMDQDYLEQIHALLEQYELRQASGAQISRRKALLEFVAEREALGEEVVVPPALITAAQKKNYAELTVDELRALDDTVRSLAHLGRLKQTLLDNRDRRDYEAVVDEFLGATFDLKKRKGLEGRNRKPNKLRQFDAALWKIETLADWLDRDNISGVMNRILIRPAVDAANREDQLHEGITRLIRNEYDAVPREQKKRWREKVTTPELIDQQTGEASVFDRSDLVAMALNTGNPSNFDKLTRGEEWTPEDVMTVLNRELSVEEWTMVQGIWDALETLWPDIAATERTLTGVEPERVVPMPIQTSAGELRGGYYPVVYDPARRANAAGWAALETADLFNGVIRGAATSKGHTKERTNYAGPVLLSVEGVLFGHLNKVIKRIAFAEYVASARKFIIDDRVRKVITDKVGPEYYDQLMPWLQGQVTDRGGSNRDLIGLEAFVKRARLNFQMVAMGLRVTTFMAQFAGYAQSAALVGKGRLAASIVNYAMSIRLGRNSLADFVFEKSPEMASRMQTRDRDIRDAMRELTGKGGVLSEIQRAAFVHIGIGDQMVSVPTWLAAYQEVLAKGGEESDAIAAGDKAVRRSQGLGREYALAAVQRPNSEFMKLFTLFYSYFSVQYNRQRDMARYATTGDPAQAISLAWWVMIVAPVMGALLTGDWPDEDDGEGIEGWASWASRKMFFNLFSGVPGVRDFASYAERKVGGEYASYSPTPLSRVGSSVETLSKDVSDLATGEDVSDRWLKHAIETPGYFIGLPTGQVSNTAQYILDVFDGSQQPENIGEFLYGLAKGPQESQE